MGAPARSATNAPPASPSASPSTVPASAISPCLDDGQERELPRPRAGPGEATASCASISRRGALAPRRSRTRSQHRGLGRRRAASSVARRAGPSSCAERNSSTGATRSRSAVRACSSRARPRGAGGELVDLPEPRGSRAPAARPRRSCDRAGRAPAPQQEPPLPRRGRAAAAAGRWYPAAARDHCGLTSASRERVVGRGQEVAEEDASTRAPPRPTSTRRSTSEAPAAGRRRAAAAPRTALGPARPRQPSRAELDPSARRPLDAAEPGEVRPRSSSRERAPARAAPVRPRSGAPLALACRGPAEAVRLPRHAEPDGADGPRSLGIRSTA